MKTLDFEPFGFFIKKGLFELIHTTVFSEAVQLFRTFKMNFRGQNFEKGLSLDFRIFWKTPVLKHLMLLLVTPVKHGTELEKQEEYAGLNGLG